MKMAQPQEKLVSINENVEFGVLTAGSGKPVVYLHGDEGLTWNPFLEELSNHFQVFAPHLPGTGSSKGLENINNIFDLVLAYDDLFTILGFEKVNIIGHSLGGMVAAELAAINPNRIEHLIAISPYGLFKDEDPIPDQFGLLGSEVLDLIVVDRNSEAAQFIQYVPEDPFEANEADIRKRQNKAAAAKFLWRIPDLGLKSRIHRIKSKTLLIWGREDGLIPASYGQEFQKLIPLSDLAIFENASHLVAIEQTPEVISLIRNFLKMNNFDYHAK